MSKWLRRSFASILVLFAAILFTISSCTIAVQEAAFNANTYKNAFENQNIYADLLPFALPAIVEVANLSQPTEITLLINDLAPEQQAMFTNALVSPEWLQQQTEIILDVIFAMLNGDFNALNERLDTSSITSRLTGLEAQATAQMILSQMTDCTVRQVSQLRTIESGNGNQLPLCNPPEELAETSLTALTSWMAEVGARINSLPITPRDLLEIDQTTARVLNIAFQLEMQAAILVYLCPAALLALIVAIAVRSLKGFGRWLGVTGIITGAFIILLLIGLQVIVINSFAELFTASNEAQQFRAQLGAGLIRSAFENMSGLILLQAAIFVGAGFILFFVSMIAPASPDHMPSGTVIITEDGQIISTASNRISKINESGS